MIPSYPDPAPIDLQWEFATSINGGFRPGRAISQKSDGISRAVVVFAPCLGDSCTRIWHTQRLLSIGESLLLIGIGFAVYAHSLREMSFLLRTHTKALSRLVATPISRGPIAMRMVLIGEISGTNATPDLH